MSGPRDFKVYYRETRGIKFRRFFLPLLRFLVSSVDNDPRMIRLHAIAFFFLSHGLPTLTDPETRIEAFNSRVIKICDRTRRGQGATKWKLTRSLGYK